MRTREERKQRGVALFLAIFALLLLSAIGLAMLFSSDTETSISINYRDKQAAIYGALAGLQEARDRIHPLSGDLAIGTNLSSGGLNIVPTVLPSSSSPNVLYIINPAPGETVAPWLPTISGKPNPYFDDELCHEAYFVTNLGVTAGTGGVPCPATSASVPSGSSWYTYFDNSQMQTKGGTTGGGSATDPTTAAYMEAAYQLTSGSTKVPLTYKWVRISLKSDNMTPVPVSSGDSTQVCWNSNPTVGVGREQLLPAGYHTDCTPPTGGITNIAITAYGSGYTSPPTVTIVGGGGSGATAVATCPNPITGVDPCFGPLASGGLSSATLTNPGAGYTSPPNVTVVPPDGYGTGGVVKALMAVTVPVASVSVTSSPTACYQHGSVPSISFSPGTPTTATATAVMSPYSCVYSFTATGKCKSSGDTASVTGPGGFTGTLRAQSGTSGKSVTGSEKVTNPGSHSYGTISPATSLFTVSDATGHCTTQGGNASISSVTTGDTISSVTVTNGGAYQAGNPPSVAVAGATPVGGSSSATATLSSSALPSPLSGLYIPVGGNGSGYDVNPEPLNIAAPSCTPGPTCIQATGTASITVSNGVLGIKITNPGTGYSQSSPPTVVISGGGGSGTTAVAYVGSAGAYMGPTYVLTSLAVTPSGARAMAQMEVGVGYQNYTLGKGGALTLIGSTPSFGTPYSMPFQMVGTDCTVGPCPPGCSGPQCNNNPPVPPNCNTTPQSPVDAIGVYDPTNATDPSAVQTVINDLGKPNNYIGANSAPDVANANLGSPTAAELDAVVDVIAQQLAGPSNTYGSRTSPVNNPTLNYMGTATNPSYNVVYGNYTMGPTAGYGILVVTGTLTISGDYWWNGVILVIGAGASVMNGGGHGQINGTVYVANTSGGTLSNPVANWSGGGGNGIQYDHCWADLLNNVPKVPAINPNALQVVSTRTEVY